MAKKVRLVRICLIADVRSPIAQNWIRYLIRAGHEIHLISSYPCAAESLSVASFYTAPVAFSWLPTRKLAEARSQLHGARRRSVRTCLSKDKLLAAGMMVKYWFGPLDMYRHVGKVRQLIGTIKPDLVHAMRIPFEGMLAAEGLRDSRLPLLVSVWGNDFTLQAYGSPLMRHMTRRTLRRADALHPDCYRDLQMAYQWGFAVTKPAVVLPSGGGIQTDVFHPGPPTAQIAERWKIPVATHVVLNPRGIRGYVRNDTFFQAIPLVREKNPTVTFLGLAMQGVRVAEEWVERLQISPATYLLPAVSRAEMADLFRLATVTVSPSDHDGTPNTLLESMACGAFPVAGNIESVREWLEDGVNGLLCDQRSPESLASAILRALDDSELRAKAAVHNQRLVAERAEHEKVMARAEAFYLQVMQETSQTRTSIRN